MIQQQGSLGHRKTFRSVRIGGWLRAFRCIRFASVFHLAFIVVMAMPFAAGCNSLGLGGGFGSGKLLQELRNENDRLLSEFRAERDRRENAEKTLRVLENRLSESEKLLARRYSPSGNYGQVPFTADLRGLSGNSYRRNAAPTGPIVRSQSGSSQFNTATGYGMADPDSGLRWQRRMSR